MLNLEDVLKLINNGLTDSPLAQQDGIGHRSYQLGFHIFPELGNQMNALEKQLLKKGFRQVALIAKKLAKQLVDKTLHLQRGAVIGVSRSKHNIHQVSGIAGDHVQLEPIKPADRAVPAGSQALKYFVAVNTAIVTHAKWGSNR